MRALTLWRPWTDAIVHGGKRIENRPWKPWRSIIGNRIAIHAGIRYDEEGAAFMREEDLFDPPADADSPQGIVGIATVTGYIEEQDTPSLFAPDPHLSDPWFMGPFGWLLKDVIALPKPVPCRGTQAPRLWPLPPRVDVEVERQLSGATEREHTEAR